MGSMRNTEKVLLCAAMSALSVSSFAFDAIKDRPTPPKSIFNETPEQRDARRAWWQHDRFGMFIHFGLYATPARHEWVQSNERISPDNYMKRYMPHFNPDLFDAKDWARRAKKAGMKYVVLTAKHHEGFCMWDTKTTDFKITKTEFKRDLVREFVDAVRAEGLKVGFYFSIKDWHHPDYLIDTTHPSRPGSFNDTTYARVNAGRDWNRYRAYMFDQVKELLTNYGKIDIIWFDYVVKTKYGKNWKLFEAVDLVKMARALQPHILIDSRLDLMDTEDGWDFVTPEQFRITRTPQVGGKDAPWELCQTFSGAWGYHRDENTWKDPHQLIEILINCVSFNGNLILNVGPTARGEFDSRACDRLDALGKWMHANDRAIYGCGKAPDDIVAPPGTQLTYNKETNRLYIHLLDYPAEYLPITFANRIDYMQFLHDGSELKVQHGWAFDHAQSGELGMVDFIKLPVVKPNVEIPVIEIFLK